MHLNSFEQKIYSKTNQKPRYYVVVFFAANKCIFKTKEKLTNYYDYRLTTPPPRLCTDNAEMIAWAAIEMIQEGYHLLL